MKRKGVVAMVLVLEVLLMSVRAEGAASSLSDTLSKEQFERAGLHKLTPQELAYLNSIVSRSPRLPAAESAFGAAPQALVQPVPDLPAGDAAFGADEELARKVRVVQKVPDKITSRIIGKFEGWSGRTEFKLENGQRWRQADGSSFHVRLESPLVTVRRGALGAYFLSVEGYNARAKVRRVD